MPSLASVSTWRPCEPSHVGWKQISGINTYSFICSFSAPSPGKLCQEHHWELLAFLQKTQPHLHYGHTGVPASHDPRPPVVIWSTHHPCKKSSG